MYYKTSIGHIIPDEKSSKDMYVPLLFKRDHYYYWYAVLDERTCSECYRHHRKIFSRQESPEEYGRKHAFCRCRRESVQGVKLGTATMNKTDGADFWLKKYRLLPTYYITQGDLEKLGWKRGDRPSRFAPGKMVTMGVYYNYGGILPEAPGRIWYEADINYTQGRRNGQRIVWSNDGLVFVTYDHYFTFYEIF